MFSVRWSALHMSIYVNEIMLFNKFLLWIAIRFTPNKNIAVNVSVSHDVHVAYTWDGKYENLHYLMINSEIKILPWV